MTIRGLTPRLSYCSTLTTGHRPLIHIVSFFETSLEEGSFPGNEKLYYTHDPETPKRHTHTLSLSPRRRRAPGHPLVGSNAPTYTLRT